MKEQIMKMFYLNNIKFMLSNELKIVLFDHFWLRIK